MLRIAGTIFLLALAGPVRSQVSDDFTDGDFTANPAWSGDVTDFTVNASQQLQLNAAAAGTSYLSVAAAASSLDQTEWRFFIKLDFSPSANNYARVYLVSDQPALESPLNGYYLQFGENLGNDAIELFRQTATATVSVARGTDGFIASAFAVRVRVTRDASGLWSIYADPAGGTAFTLQATGTDATYTTNGWLGVVCQYTVSNITHFTFDDFYFGAMLADTLPPAIAAVAATGPAMLDVTFDEPVDAVTAGTLTNYSVDNGIGNPASAVPDANPALVHLTFASAFQGGQGYTLTVTGVKDLNGNTIGNAMKPFVYATPPDSFDVVINEVFFAFHDPQGLPKAEYVELYNRSAKAFDLAGWTIEDNTGNPAAIGPAVLPPGGYMIVCDASDVSSFAGFGAVAGVASFPELNDDGDDIVVRAGGTVVDALTYDDGFYHDVQKSAGGFSIERIDPDFLCPDAGNWHASGSPLGGTPGHLNSVDGVFEDVVPPRLSRAYLSAADRVVAVFSETMDEGQLADPSMYAVSGWGQPSSVAALSPHEAELAYGAVFDSSTVYTLTASAAMQDCPGNALARTTGRFRVPEDAAVSDVLINEVLFDPFPGGSEFLELYNRSQKTVDLSALRLYEVGPDGQTLLNPLIVSAVPWLLFPGAFAVLSRDDNGIVPHYDIRDPDAFVNMASFPSLNNDEDHVALTDLAGNRIDQFRYNEDFQFPLLNDASGVSLERISYDRPTQDSTNWHSASAPAGYATPGYENSQHAEAVAGDGEITVSPEVFSPDNDGHDDVVQFSYRFGEPGFVGNVKIFDATGVEVIYLVKNELLGTEGAFSWDGLDAAREKARTGIYIMYMEAFSVTGTVKHFKKPFVLAARLR